MATWITPTVDELKTQGFSPSELAQLQAIANYDAKAQEFIDNAVAMFRDADEAGGGTLGDDGTIAPGYKSDVLAVARWNWLISLPKRELLQTEARKAAHDEARKRFDKIATGDLRVAPPAGEASPFPAPSIEDRTRTFDHDSQDGL